MLVEDERAVADQHQIGEGATDVDADAIARARHARLATPKGGSATREPGASTPGAGARLARMRTGDADRMGRDVEGHRRASGRQVSGCGRGVIARLLVLCLIVAVAGCARPVRRRPQPQPSALPPIAARGAPNRPRAPAPAAPFFRAAGVPYPPTRFVLLGLKQERELQLFAAGPGQQLAFIRIYPIWGASGGLGPKLREGDRQVPEGIYTIAYMNPNSISHLS